MIVRADPKSHTASAVEQLSRATADPICQQDSAVINPLSLRATLPTGKAGEGGEAICGTIVIPDLSILGNLIGDLVCHPELVEGS